MKLLITGFIGPILLLAVGLLTVWVGILMLVPDDRLIGYGCGPEGVTMTANEEDEFPVCDAIEKK